MQLIDFIIGFFLMNAMPHFVLGVWNGRILSLFGFGKWANIGYGLLNFVVANTLFLYQYGINGYAEHGIFAGAMLVLVIYLITGESIRRVFAKKTGNDS